MKPQELTVDYLLGRIIRLHSVPWRVLEINPQKDRVRTIRCEDGLRGLFSLKALWREIQTGHVEVE